MTGREPEEYRQARRDYDVAVLALEAAESDHEADVDRAWRGVRAGTPETQHLADDQFVEDVAAADHARDRAIVDVLRARRRLTDLAIRHGLPTEGVRR